MQAEIDQLKSALAALQGRQAGSATEAAPAPQEISPETLVMLAAVATTFLGKKVKVRSAKMLQTPYEIVNPWAQYGRVSVQASHNLPRGR
jgi:hypothetical protein